MRRRAETVAAEIRAELAGEASLHALDISDYDAVTRAVAAFEAATGPVSFLVNNAGWDRAANFLDTDAGVLAQDHRHQSLGPAQRQPRRAEAAWRRAASAGWSTSPPMPAASARRARRSIRPARAASSRSPRRWRANWSARASSSTRVCPGPTDTAILRSFLEGPDGTRIAEGLKRAIPMRRLGAARGLSRPRRVPALRRRRLHHRPDHQRVRRPHHARMRPHDERHTRTFSTRSATASRASPSTGRRSTTPSRAETCEELIDAFQRAGWDKSVGVIVLAGAGDKRVLHRRRPERARGQLRRAAAPSACRSTSCSRSSATCRSR